MPLFTETRVGLKIKRGDIILFAGRKCIVSTADNFGGAIHLSPLGSTAFWAIKKETLDRIGFGITWSFFP